MNRPVAAPRRENTADRRRAIALAARALIVEKGFEGLRTRDIAERVGINVATLHYHVPTKQALVALLAEGMRDDFIAQHMATERTGLSALAEFRLELDEFRDILLEKPDLHIALAELAEKARRDPDVAAAINPLRHRWMDQMIQILSRGMDDGSFRQDLDPQAATVMVLGALTSFPRFADFTPAFFDRFADQLVRAVVPPSDRTDQQ